MMPLSLWERGWGEGLERPILAAKLLNIGRLGPHPALSNRERYLHNFESL